MMAIFMVTGCSSQKVVCTPPAGIDTIVVVPFKSDTTFVEEEKYNNLPPAIATETTAQLIKYLENSHMFSKVIQSSGCLANAVKIDGKIASLVHHKGNFTIIARGNVTNCQTKIEIEKFENSNSDSKSVKLPNKIAEEVADDFRQIICKKH
jgi:hypothetical protein